ncbi:heme A synthase [Herbaspirillum seropedicae]|uniref:Heme O oxygenase (Cytochrome aa3-controlling) transmembrane protein n=1 Tax=Herbaspirillum seropedicae (strain SmR1) TaxID=757424 RepID=D8ITJ3_HERSS|nr:COX15/CtaA family protein [Herbaspirillum seropedicae]ADJ65623.1 heme O oxygenase (cytochrome aa3-controlling) transmembrane protein [Herbaspirillum seropedicae SmR1]AKN67442.1 cytochrome C oxidase subunit I [Herbaspirillum seropedicae]NQE32033.1 cytochrome c oxidase subunit I [Herbaspirillum seropedicae]UMU23449.1 heme A synthase [Herbaspirillum seropedicae]
MTATMLIQLGLTGLVVALIPLAVVWRAQGAANKYRKLVWVTLFFTFDLIMFGAFTRLTDSGLGCPDWPGCYSHANPLLAHEHINAAQEAMPTGPVTWAKAWIEMTHRYFAMAVGFLIIVLMVAAWWRWIRSGKTELQFRPWFPTALLGFVCLQGAFGAWTVTMKLQPIIVTLHLLLGLNLLAMLTWLAARQEPHLPVSPAGRALIVPATLGAALLGLQIALGGWVSTNYAALACTDFPLCDGKLVPDMDFAHGFTLWRHLGMTSGGDYLPFQALTAIHWVHRSFAFVVILYVVWLAHRALREEGLRKTGRWLLTVLGLQLCTGLATIYLNWPLAIAVVHNGGAALLVILMVMLNYKVRYAPSGQAIAAPPATARPVTP